MFIYFWERERSREKGRHRIRSRLQAPSYQHRARRGARTHEPRDHDLSWSRTPNRLSHPGTPIRLILHTHILRLHINPFLPLSLNLQWNLLCSLFYPGLTLHASVLGHSLPPKNFFFLPSFLSFFVLLSFFVFYFFNFLFIFERQNASREEQRERETQNLKQATASELSAQSPTWGSNSGTVRSRPEPKSDAQPTEPPRRPYTL